MLKKMYKQSWVMLVQTITSKIIQKNKTLQFLLLFKSIWFLSTVKARLIYSSSTSKNCSSFPFCTICYLTVFMYSNCPLIKITSPAITVVITLPLIVIVHIQSHNGENFLNGKHSVCICGRFVFRLKFKHTRSLSAIFLKKAYDLSDKKCITCLI